MQAPLSTSRRLVLQASEGKWAAQAITVITGVIVFGAEEMPTVVHMMPPLASKFFAFAAC